MAETFAAALQQAAKREVATGHAPGRSRTKKGGMADLSHGTTGDVMRFNPYTLLLRPDMSIRPPDRASTQDYVTALAQTIRHYGQPFPVEVMWDRTVRRPVVTDDGCVVLAVRKLIEEGGCEIHTVTAVSCPVGNSQVDQMARSFRDGTRSPSVLEKAAQVQKMVTLFGLTIPQIAQRIHTDAETVRQWVDQAQMLSPPLYALVDGGALALSLACRVIREHDYDTDAALAEIMQAIEVSEDGRARPRHPRQVRAQCRESTPTETVRDILRTGTVVPSPAVSLVTVTMEQSQFEALRAGVREGGDNVEITEA